ncbi:nucleotide-sugar transporter [Magnaporthiopsis poae ATCC 64411]|uniref:Nucleotide-sugar transporter n=1 Tax=Magnaporthiopsis poae (strain ATCC 64411 / 73-15) TaxID=644358 RepID=A0A0C4DTD6_MAGP6|nr:nucleotide-sugar transporter [Magnaporthiopsis poae ATCC 64411]
MPMPTEAEDTSTDPLAQVAIKTMSSRPATQACSSRGPPNSGIGQPAPSDRRLPTTTTTTAPPADQPAPTTSDSLSTTSSARPTPTRSSGSHSPSSSGGVDQLSPSAPVSATPLSSLRPGGAASASASAFGSRVPQPPESAIEMEPLKPPGHRRRTSSLMNPVNNNNSNTAASDPPTKRGTRAGAGGSGSGGGAGSGAIGGGSSGAGLPTDTTRTISKEPVGSVGAGKRGAGRPPPRDSDSDSVSDEDLHGDEETGLTKSHRLRKLEKRRRNTRLDQRIARDGGGVTEQEKREADKTVVRRLLINLSLIGLWYMFSLSISIYNKWMFDSKQLDFPFPMFTTSIHMLIQFGLSTAVLYFVPSLRPRNGGTRGGGSDRGRSRHEMGGPERPLMTKWFYLTRIGPCGAATGLDIGLGNTSLKLITLTFYTMCKSSVLAFVLLFAFLFRLETPTWRLFAIIGTMTVGVVMMVAGEVEFRLGGFLLVISAAFFSGFRWGLTQILLLRNPATSNPFSSIFFLAPVMFVTLFSIAVFVEGVPELWQGIKVLAEAKGVVAAPVIVLFPGAIAFFMTVSEFALLQRTSVVTLSIAGIFKEVVTILAATLVFGDRLTPINFAGLVVTLAAICCYNYLKITKMREEALLAAATAHNNNAATASSSGSGSEAEPDADAEDAGLLRRLSGDGGGGGSRTPRWTADGELPLPATPGISPRPRQRED